MAPTGRYVWRDFVSDGIPSSGKHNPSKKDIRAWTAYLESLLAAVIVAGGKLYTSLAAMNADLTPDAHTPALVIGDPTVANNGLYVKVGAAGAGSWSRVGDVPGYQFVRAENVGAGTPNAIVATSSLPISIDVLVYLPIAATTTANPVTVSFNGAPALTVKTVSGNDPVAGGLVEGMVALGVVSGSTFRLLSDQASAAIIDLAQAAAEAALASANAGFVFDSVEAFIESNVPGVLTFVRTAGYYAPGDGGGATYSRLVSAPSVIKPWHKHSADGAWWLLSASQNLHVEMFGAIGKTQSELEAMDGVGAEVWASGTTLAVQNAVDFRAEYGGGKLFAMKQFYSISGVGIEILEGVHLHCSGFDEWEPVYNNAKVWAGTTWLLYGTGTKHLRFEGITSGQHGGGWRPDPDVPGTYYKIFTGYNSDASGVTPATPKEFSAGFWSEESCNNGLYDCRIAPWCGTNGIEGYDDPAGGLGADWDLLCVCLNGDGLRRERIQPVGYSREPAFIAATTTSINSRMEKCRFEDITAQGRGGIAIRSPDRWAVYNTTANSFEIEWSNEHYFDPSGGTTFRLSDGVNRTYTNTVMVGSRLKFEGVSPSPAGTFHLRHAGRGWAGTTIRGTHCYSIFHHSGAAVESLGLAKMAASQVSGFPLRGLLFDGKNKVHCSNRVGERAIMQLWDAQDCYFSGAFQPEGGRWMFATDINTSVDTVSAPSLYCSAPVGECRNIRFENSDGMDDLAAAGYLAQTWFPRNAFDLSRQIGGRQYLDGHNHILPHRAGKRNILHDDTLAEFFDCREIAATSAGFGFVTVSTQTCSWRYIKIGKMVFFKLVHIWTGLDTADTSAISIRLPVDASANSILDGTINDRRSTGINLGGTDNPYLDLATDNFMGISVGNTTRLTYGALSAAGEIHVSGKYWID